MEFKPEEKTIKDLLVSGHQFEIPRFQRAYSWEKRHYAEFLNDIILNLKIDEGVVKADAYFVGTMLFIGNFVEANKSVIKVVDGQQRLTTITILFSVLSDLFKKIGETSLAERIFNYIMGTDDDNREVRILKTKSNYPYFALYIQDFYKNTAPNPESEEEDNIRQTYEYFYANLQDKRLRSYLKQNNGSVDVDRLNYIDILKGIRDQVLACTFISISTSSYDQANRIFEILNAKGKRLDEVDLIKNRIFEVLNREEPVDFANERWTKIRKTIEDLDSGVGMSTFYRHFWSAVYKKTASGKLYDDFKRNVHSNRTRYMEFLSEMELFASYYAEIINPDIKHYDNRQEYRWLVQSLNALTNTFGIVQVRVPLMVLLDAKKRDVLGMSIFKNCVLYLENFHFAFNVIVSDRGNKLDTIYSKFANELHKSQNKSDSQVQVNWLLSKMEELFPSYNKFRDAFVKLAFYKGSLPSNLKTKYALYKLNAYYSEDEVFPTNLSVEHIYPESKSSDSCSIGNLILLERVLNNEAENKDYDKKKIVYKKSSLKWLSIFLTKYPSWNALDFDMRANELAEFYYTHVLGREINDSDSSA